MSVSDIYKQLDLLAMKVLYWNQEQGVSYVTLSITIVASTCPFPL